MNLTHNRNRFIKLFAILPFKRQIIEMANAVRRRHLKSIKTPENLILFVTNRCNARCHHCFYWRQLNNSEQELSLEQLRLTVSSLKNRLETVSITGGEPLLRSDLYEIIELFSQINNTRKVHLATNGSLTEILFRLCKSILDNLKLELSVQISLDGDEAYHNALRGSDFYRKAIASLQTLNTLKAHHRNFLLSAVTTLTTSNLTIIPSVAREMRKLNIPWGFNLLRSSTYGILGLNGKDIAHYNPHDDALELPAPDIIRRLMDEQAPPRKELGRMLERALLKNSLTILARQRPALICRAGVVDGVIYPNGDVALCEITNPFANLRNYGYDFYKLWSSDKAHEARGRITHCACMHGCHMVNAMKYDYRFILDGFRQEENA